VRCLPGEVAADVEVGEDREARLVAVHAVVAGARVRDAAASSKIEGIGRPWRRPVS
jgi:hypothetical protein